MHLSPHQSEARAPSDTLAIHCVHNVSVWGWNEIEMVNVCLRSVCVFVTFLCIVFVYEVCNKTYWEEL